MAQVTALSVCGHPGGLHAFVAKGAAPPVVPVVVVTGDFTTVPPPPRDQEFDPGRPTDAVMSFVFPTIQKASPPPKVSHGISFSRRKK